MLILLLAGAAVWQGEAGHFFQYRGQARWSGPWDNPNTFGVLVGAGAVLAIGLAVLSLKSKGQRQLSARCKREAGRDHPSSKCGMWAGRVFLLAAAGMMGLGLLKSYSRGAWVGVAVALAYLAYQVSKAPSRKDSSHERHERQAGKTAFPLSCTSSISWLPFSRTNSLALAVACASVVVLGFWSFGHTERAVARRAYSVANANDFSWRNRVAAWEGALQMMAEKPWFGFGWNQPERVYDQYYRAAKVNEGMAIQLNDYFTLGATLGLPALLCFAMYVGLSLARPLATDYRSLITDYGPLTTDYWLQTTCRAGAIVLLIGFWFAGGLFKLATAAPFWILLELGRTGGHEIHPPSAVLLRRTGEAHENE